PHLPPSPTRRPSDLARNVATHLAHPRRILELTAGLLEAQVERLPAQLQQLFFQLVGRLGPKIDCLHGVSSPRRGALRNASEPEADRKSTRLNSSHVK